MDTVYNHSVNELIELSNSVNILKGHISSHEFTKLEASDKSKARKTLIVIERELDKQVSNWSS